MAILEDKRGVLPYYNSPTNSAVEAAQRWLTAFEHPGDSSRPNVGLTGKVVCEGT
jgi:hypothetical protein